jgi:ligand-binding SRPBCC domain-containing protein
MPIYQFETKQLIPAKIDEVWNFMSSPKNLKKITPDYLGFEIISKNLPEKMYPGMLISYIVKPLFNIPVNWVTQISQVQYPNYFIDTQMSGPYSIWHHQHHLYQQDNGVLMIDIVTYKPPFGFFGAIANSLFIKKQLNEIFDYRYKAIEKLFPLQTTHSQ